MLFHHRGILYIEKYNGIHPFHKSFYWHVIQTSLKESSSSRFCPLIWCWRLISVLQLFITWVLAGADDDVMIDESSMDQNIQMRFACDSIFVFLSCMQSPNDKRGIQEFSTSSMNACLVDGSWVVYWTLINFHSCELWIWFWVEKKRKLTERSFTQKLFSVYLALWFRSVHIMKIGWNTTFSVLWFFCGVFWKSVNVTAMSSAVTMDYIASELIITSSSSVGKVKFSMKYRNSWIQHKFNGFEKFKIHAQHRVSPGIPISIFSRYFSSRTLERLWTLIQIFEQSIHPVS